MCVCCVRKMASHLVNIVLAHMKNQHSTNSLTRQSFSYTHWMLRTNISTKKTYGFSEFMVCKCAYIYFYFDFSIVKRLPYKIWIIFYAYLFFFLFFFGCGFLVFSIKSSFFMIQLAQNFLYLQIHFENIIKL